MHILPGQERQLFQTLRIVETDKTSDLHKPDLHLTAVKNLMLGLERENIHFTLIKVQTQDRLFQD